MNGRGDTVQGESYPARFAKYNKVNRGFLTVNEGEKEKDISLSPFYIQPTRPLPENNLHF